MVWHFKKKELPNEFYRAIKDKPGWFNPANNSVLAQAYQFQKCKKRNYCELSIQYNDSPNALKKLMNAKAFDGTYLASKGYVCFTIPFVLTLFKSEFEDQIMFLERSPILKFEKFKFKVNLSHGNLLINKQHDKGRVKFIMSMMAQFSTTNLNSREDYFNTETNKSLFILK